MAEMIGRWIKTMTGTREVKKLEAAVLTNLETTFLLYGNTRETASSHPSQYQEPIPSPWHEWRGGFRSRKQNSPSTVWL